MKAYKIDLKQSQYVGLYITSEKDAEDAVKALLKSEATIFGADTETGKLPRYKNDPQSGLDPHKSFISLLQFYDYTTKRVYMFDTHFIHNWKSILNEFITTKNLVFHNAIFDLSHLVYNGFIFKDKTKINCTQIMYYFYRDVEEVEEKDEDAIEEGDGQKPDWLTQSEWRGGSLKSIVARFLGIYVDKEPQASDWTNRPLSTTQIIYAMSDSIHTYECYRILSESLKKHGMVKVYALNRKAMHSVVRMQLTGMKLDTKKHSEHIALWQKESEAAQKETIKYFGSETNIKSSVQLSKFFESNLPDEILDNWATSEKTGRLKSDAKTLTNKVKAVPQLEYLLKYKKLEKMISTYGDSLLQKISSETGRLHGRYTLGWTHTGRLSSREPNVQNYPRNIEFREIFIAEPGNIIVAADYSQIEVRIAAHMSKEQRMLKAFRQNADIYKVTGALILGKKIEQITKQERQVAKSALLGILYGLGARGLGDYSRYNYGVDITDEEAQKFWYKFFDAYPDFAKWQQVTRTRAEAVGFTATPLGKKRALAANQVYTKSVNHPIQGASAEITISALCRLNSVFSNKVQILCSVHDEILLECSESLADKVGNILVDQMRAAVVDVLPSANETGIMTNIVEYTLGKTWAETKKS